MVFHKSLGFITWATKKQNTLPYYFPLNPACLIGIGILIMAYYTPHIIGKYNPLHNPTNQGFFSLLTWRFSFSFLSPITWPKKEGTFVSKLRLAYPPLLEPQSLANLGFQTGKVAMAIKTSNKFVQTHHLSGNKTLGIIMYTDWLIWILKKKVWYNP